MTTDKNSTREIVQRDVRQALDYLERVASVLIDAQGSLNEELKGRRMLEVRRLTDDAINRLAWLCDWMEAA